jgi:hypothetical protein
VDMIQAAIMTAEQGVVPLSEQQLATGFDAVVTR